MDTEHIVLTKMEQIALNAKRLPDVSFTSLREVIKLRVQDGVITSMRVAKL